MNFISRLTKFFLRHREEIERLPFSDAEKVKERVNNNDDAPEAYRNNQKPNENERENSDNSERAHEVAASAQQVAETDEGSGRTGRSLEERAEREGEELRRIIEERNLPTESDGVPRFNGRKGKYSSPSDFFSMAREA